RLLVEWWVARGVVVGKRWYLERHLGSFPSCAEANGFDAPAGGMLSRSATSKGARLAVGAAEAAQAPERQAKPRTGGISIAYPSATSMSPGTWRTQTRTTSTATATASAARRRSGVLR